MVESSEPQAASTGKDGTTESGNKRSEPPVSEKLSPEKKVSRTESPTAATGDSHVKRALFGDCQPTESTNVLKSPEDHAGTGGTIDGNNAQLLALAMEKISALEAKLSVAMSARPAPPPTPAVTAVEVTPPPSKAPVTSPTPSTSGPKSSAAGDGDENERDEGKQETEGDDMIVMPSGNKVSYLYLYIKMSKMQKGMYNTAATMLASKYILECIYLNKKDSPATNA